MEWRIIEAEEQHAESYHKMVLQLDHETEYMLYEIGERKVTVEQIQQKLKHRVPQEEGLFLVEDKATQTIGGFISASRGYQNRIRHSAYIVVGLLANFRGLGIGTAFFNEIEKWAQANQISRLELTVMAHNVAGIGLYEKAGFFKEGVKKNSVYVNGQFYDEFYMAKLL